MAQQSNMNKAVEEALEGLQKNGGPFGCVIVKNGKVVGKGHNMVTSTNDPTAHAEVLAIRDACKKLNTFILTDCDLYTTCEPCPMCFGAIYWSRVKTVYYGAERSDAAEVGFDDSIIYEEIKQGVHDNRLIPFKQVARVTALKVFETWSSDQDKIMY
ncbi:guanine deaminase-like [Bolinopsis microptera]|uniref:guanine deaminase-like n=1 Tax=Bolinopsis microptera TaxID=2820187 RepID=UPI0030797FE2